MTRSSRTQSHYIASGTEGSTKVLKAADTVDNLVCSPLWSVRFSSLTRKNPVELGKNTVELGKNPVELGKNPVELVTPAR